MSDTTTAELLAKMIDVVTSPSASNKVRREVIIDAYEIGFAAGRLEGGKAMSERMLATFDEAWKRSKEGAA